METSRKEALLKMQWLKDMNPDTKLDVQIVPVVPDRITAEFDYCASEQKQADAVTDAWLAAHRNIAKKITDLLDQMGAEYNQGTTFAEFGFIIAQLTCAQIEKLAELSEVQDICR
jgi:hypothetical protein